jgi:hypothetical protein
MKSAKQPQPVENCCPGDTGDLVLRCGKVLVIERKWPESALFRRLPASLKFIGYARFTCVA